MVQNERRQWWEVNFRLVLMLLAGISYCAIVAVVLPFDTNAWPSARILGPIVAVATGFGLWHFLRRLLKSRP